MKIEKKVFTAQDVLDVLVILAGDFTDDKFKSLPTNLTSEYINVLMNLRRLIMLSAEDYEQLDEWLISVDRDNEYYKFLRSNYEDEHFETDKLTAFLSELDNLDTRKE